MAVHGGGLEEVGSLCPVQSSGRCCLPAHPHSRPLPACAPLSSASPQQQHAGQPCMPAGDHIPLPSGDPSLKLSLERTFPFQEKAHPVRFQLCLMFC